MSNNNNVNNSDIKSEASSVLSDTSSQSPKVLKKKGGIFGGQNSSQSLTTSHSGQKSQNKSLFKKFKVSNKDHSSNSSVHSTSSHPHGISSDGSIENNLSKLENISERQALIDDRHRRRFFSHYDIGSLCATLNLNAKMKAHERRNVTTGASAASAALRGADDTNNEDIDHGDNVSNDLVLR